MFSDPIKSSTSVFAAGEDSKVLLLSILFTKTQMIKREETRKHANAGEPQQTAEWQEQQLAIKFSRTLTRLCT